MSPTQRAYRLHCAVGFAVMNGQDVGKAVMEHFLDLYYEENEPRIRREVEVMRRLRDRRGRPYLKYRLWKKKFKQALAAEGI